MKASKRVLSLRAMLVPAILLALMLCLTTYVGAYDDWKDYGAPETGLTIYEDQVMIKNLGYNTVYGLKDSAGNIVLPAKYDRISYAGKNRLLVSTDNPFAFNRIVDLRGNLLYGDGSEHFEYYKGQNVFGVSKLGKEAQYLMDGNYKRLTKDYSAVRYLDEGYFLLKNWRRSECDDDVVCGVYRLGVGEIIPVKYRNIRFLKGSNDLLVVENSSYLRGLYDNNGKQVLPEAYSLLDSCSGDYIVAAKYRQPEYARPGNDKFEIENQAMINAFGLLDIDGNEIVPFQYDDIRFADGGNVELMIWDGNIETQYGLMGESKMVYSYDEEVASLAELLKNQPTLIDVPTNAWYSGAVHWAAEEGMIDATARYLRPNENATRGEAVEYLRKNGEAKAVKKTENLRRESLYRFDEFRQLLYCCSVGL